MDHQAYGEKAAGIERETYRLGAIYVRVHVCRKEKYFDLNLCYFLVGQVMRTYSFCSYGHRQMGVPRKETHRKALICTT